MRDLSHYNECKSNIFDMAAKEGENWPGKMGKTRCLHELEGEGGR